MSILTERYLCGVDLKTWVFEKRTAKGWTQEKLGTEAGLDRVTINAIENGDNLGTSARVREGLTAALGEAPPKPEPRRGKGDVTRTYDAGQNPKLPAAALGQRADWTGALEACRAMWGDELDPTIIEKLAQAEFTGAPEKLSGTWIRLMHDAMKIGMKTNAETSRAVDRNISKA